MGWGVDEQMVSMDNRGAVTIRALLRRTGLLPWARDVRALVRRVRFLPENVRYWRGPHEALPVPPLRLIDLVSGQPDIPWFLEGGRRAAASLREALGAQGVAMESLGTLLDFGCGCGRVVRHWSGLPGEVHGSDLNPALVEWCRRHLRFARFERNGLAPPLPYREGSFDLVYALSVFTHLPEALQLPWMGEVRRVLRPGGFLAITTHGARYAAELAPREREAFAAGRLVVRESGEAGSNVCGAYHPPEYVRSTLAAGFEVRELRPEGAMGNPHQDLWVLRRIIH
jgi:SAM-dependent methyltransferase